MSRLEFRSELRTPTNVFVNVIVSENETYLSRATNISSKGLGISCLPENREGVRFAWLLFWLPTSDELVRALGEVVHVRQNDHLAHVGFRFKYVSPRHKALLHKYLSSRPDAERVAA